MTLSLIGKSSGLSAALKTRHEKAAEAATATMSVPTTAAMTGAPPVVAMPMQFQALTADTMAALIGVQDVAAAGAAPAPSEPVAGEDVKDTLLDMIEQKRKNPIMPASTEKDEEQAQSAEEKTEEEKYLERLREQLRQAQAAPEPTPPEAMSPDAAVAAARAAQAVQAEQAAAAAAGRSDIAEVSAQS